MKTSCFLNLILKPLKKKHIQILWFFNFFNLSGGETQNTQNLLVTIQHSDADAHGVDLPNSRIQPGDRRFVCFHPRFGEHSGNIAFFFGNILSHICIYTYI